ncbi:MAG: hypothetical protein ACRDD7_08920 [Peptostreptococcaceae bacterium]
MSSIGGTTSFERKCELIERINNFCEFWGIEQKEEISTYMSIKELSDILKDLRETLNNALKEKRWICS